MIVELFQHMSHRSSWLQLLFVLKTGRHFICSRMVEQIYFYYFLCCMHLVIFIKKPTNCACVFLFELFICFETIWGFFCSWWNKFTSFIFYVPIFIIFSPFYSNFLFVLKKSGHFLFLVWWNKFTSFA